MVVGVRYYFWPQAGIVSFDGGNWIGLEGQSDAVVLVVEKDGVS